MFCFDQFSGSELIVLASTFSIAISENKSPEEIAKLSSFFAAVGDNLAIIATTTFPE